MRDVLWKFMIKLRDLLDYCSVIYDCETGVLVLQKQNVSSHCLHVLDWTHLKSY